MGKIVTEIKSEGVQSRTCQVALVEAEDVDMVWDDVAPFNRESITSRRRRTYT